MCQGMVKFWFKIEGYTEMGTSGEGAMFLVNHHLNNVVAYIQGMEAILGENAKKNTLSVGHTFKVDMVEISKVYEQEKKEESIWRPPVSD